MSPTWAIDRLRALRDSDDTESAHSEADDILCDVLTELGGAYADVAAEWKRVPKWYA
jgi:hypothetical protein